MPVSTEFDPGPPAAPARHFAALPDLAEHRDWFWYDWGPVFYRGRLDGSARLLGIGSDPGPTEQIPRRTLVGDAGQRVQGFLTKVGLTRSYTLVNAHAYALHPDQAERAKPLLARPDLLRWRNRLLDLVSGADLQAVVAFGAQAHAAVDLWEPPTGVRVVKVPHPSSRDARVLATSWRDAVTLLRGLLTPDDDAGPPPPNYGDRLVEADYAPIPRRDLPFGLPASLGDDHWTRSRQPPQMNAVNRDGDQVVRWEVPTGPA